ncbi:MAG: twin-arginine translocase TatA/TatE family subunit [Gemmatimonadales bacterium]|nr:MAG: twin-arginine translocase TatA/TatE family subunit [Gemmatimonadales bacterium]
MKALAGAVVPWGADPSLLAVIGGLGVGELLLIVLLLILLFGAKRIPRIARGLGEGIRNFKSGVKDPDRLKGETEDDEGNRHGR